MPGKFKIIISDLHLGGGFPQINPLEDFTHDDVLSALLEELAAESDRQGADLELIVNGDAFEMLQVPHVDEYDPAQAYPSDLYHSSSEADSVRKMRLIVAGHRSLFDALGRFLRLGPPRRWVTFVKGNHDLNLYWPGVQNCLREALGATGRRSGLLVFEELCVSREGIYVEHGNQYAELIDRVDHMEKPLHPTRPGQLALPLGSWFVMDVLNPVERSRYWIDGVKPITALIWYALAFDFPFAAGALAMLLRALPGIVEEAFLDAVPMEADLQAAGRGDSLSERLEDPAQVEALAAHYQQDASFRAQFNGEVANVLAPPPEQAREPVAASLEVAPDLGDPVVMGNQVYNRALSALSFSASRQAAEKEAAVVVFGHTHHAVQEPLLGGATYINTGTWTWRADFSGAGKSTWQDLFLHPERFTNDCQLTYARIDYDEAGRPYGRLLVYGAEGSHVWVPVPVWAGRVWDRIRAWLCGWRPGS